MAYRFSRARGQFTAGTSRSGRGYTYGGRRVLLKGDNFQITWNGPAIVEQMLNTIAEALSRLSDSALSYMQTIVPVDTGRLRESCYAQVFIEDGRIILAIGAEAPYAVYVELGSSRNFPQPYIRPTFDFVISQLPMLLRNEVKNRGGRTS